MRFAFWLSFLSMSAQAGVFIRCSQSSEVQMLFELRETADEYQFLFNETAGGATKGRSAVRELTNYRVQEGHKYSMSFHSPKEIALPDQPPRPTCSFSAEHPLLFTCYAELPSPDLEIRNLSTGAKDVLRLAGFRLSNAETNEVSVTGWQEISKNQAFELTSFMQTPGPRASVLPFTTCRTLP